MVRRDTASSISIRPRRSHVQSGNSTECCGTHRRSRCFRGIAAKLIALGHARYRSVAVYFHGSTTTAG